MLLVDVRAVCHGDDKPRHQVEVLAAQIGDGGKGLHVYCTTGSRAVPAVSQVDQEIVSHPEGSLRSSKDALCFGVDNSTGSEKLV